MKNNHQEKIKNYKSILFRDGKTLVFKSNDVEKRWDDFVYITNANMVCSFFYQEFEPQDWLEYQNDLGKNVLVLNSFKSNNENKEYFKKSKLLKYRGFIKKFGISPSTFKKVFNAIMREIWFIQPYCNRYCYNNERIKEENVRRVNTHIKKIEQAVNKGFNNIVPFILYSGLCVDELGRIFEKNLWNSLKSNSHNKNNLIAQRFFNLLETCGELINNASDVKDFDKKISIKKEELNVQAIFYNKIPSTVLSKGFYLGTSDIERHTILSLLNFLKIKEFMLETKSIFHNIGNEKLYNIVYETICNAKELNLEYSINWNKEQWLDKHKEYKTLLDKLSNEDAWKDIF